MWIKRRPANPASGGAQGALHPLDGVVQGHVTSGEATLDQPRAEPPGVGGVTGGPPCSRQSSRNSAAAPVPSTDQSTVTQPVGMRAPRISRRGRQFVQNQPERERRTKGPTNSSGRGPGSVGRCRRAGSNASCTPGRRWRCRSAPASRMSCALPSTISRAARASRGGRRGWGVAQGLRGDRLDQPSGCSSAGATSSRLGCPAALPLPFGRRCR